MDDILSRFGLKYQIGLVALIGIIGMIVVGAISLAGTAEQGRLQAEAKHQTDSREIVRAIENLMLQARRHERDFFFRQKEEYVAKQNAAVKGALGKLDDMTRGGVHPEHAAMITAVKAGAEAYARDFAEVAAEKAKLGLDEKSGLLGRLRASVHEIESVLGKFDEPRLTISMLMMRRHEKDFMARQDVKYADELRKRVEEFKAILAASTVPPDVRVTIGDKLASYHRDFRAVVDGTSSVIKLGEKLSATYSQVEPILDRLVAGINKDYEEARAGAEDAQENTKRMTAWAVGIGMLVASVIAVLIVRGVLRPLLAMTTAMRGLAGGNLATDIPGRTRWDEVGQMAAAVQVFKDNALDVSRLQAEQKEHERKAEATRKAALSDLAGSFEASVKGIVRIVSSSAAELQTSAQSLSAVAEQTIRQSTAVVVASDEASTNVQTVASAAEELASSIGEISRQVTHSVSVSQGAVHQADRVNGLVNGLAEAAQKIGDVVNLINDIASQTNLLALNATIEAARAGDAGKGFAVVANEVKSLANQTARATGEISNQIAAVQSATRESVDAIKEITTTIGQISEIGGTIAAAVEQQGAATKEIARNVDAASSGTAEVSRNISGVNESSAETGRASGQVLAAARQLSEQSENLRDDVDKFIAHIRAQ